MRKYQPIWLALKLHGTASLAAPIERHRQIVLAVRKEKTQDLAWKLECLDVHRKRYRLKNISDGSMITFNLVEGELMSYATLTANDL